MFGSLVEYWKKLDNINIDCKHFLSELKYLDKDIIRNKADILQQLIAIKNNICNSTYLKEVLLNTCGFATEWIPSIWRLTNIKYFLFTITELTTLANKIGPLRYILKPISTKEVYKIMNDFITETSSQKLDRSGTCASCGHCVSRTKNNNRLEFSENVKALFCHKNVCKAT